MNGSEWHKNDTSYYVVYYREEFGRTIDVVTNDFGGWLEEINEDRVEDEEEAEETDSDLKLDADDFWLENVEVFLRKGD